MPLGGPIPVLRSFNETEARDFYVRYLGFSVEFEHRFAPGMPLYMGLRSDRCELHLSEHHGDGVPGITVRIACDDVSALLRNLKARGHRRMNPGMEEQPWGMLEVSVTDPFGNRLIFFQTV
ncbi:glyoxalase/bleomycin resistance/extradiol dioxygenase family protein [Meridianimarinicoccus roseus]|uniref:Bleomycin resistance protein n=1 Tax=Meridianimarinicoccus roseus TaxID=2072018 RepID=A0A2V2LJG3_9RHOB|nr:glyoxalase/bleomycin resistance/extradiol dioxygenase family protein [Meridianimarinicoccus roseus]